MLALYIVAGILLVIVLVLSVPVDLVFDFRTGRGGERILRIEWLFGMVGKGLLPRKKAARKPKKLGKPRRGRRGDFRSFLVMVRVRGVLVGVIRLVRRMVSSLRVRRLDAGLRLGLDDPADTGMMYAVLWPAFISPGLFPKARLRVEPVFTEPIFEAAIQGEVRVFPAEVVANFVCFVLSPAGLRLLRSMAVSRWKRKS